MPLSRRRFLRTAAATSAAFAGLPALSARTRDDQAQAYLSQVEGYGPLHRDPAGLFDLPQDFSYRVLSEMGQEMDDGLLTPGDFDGMACFQGADGLITLLRNHELHPDEVEKSAFGPNAERLDRIDRSRIWDWAAPGAPHLGGVTHLLVDPVTLEVRSHYLSLAGTSTNCAGGPTPWGSWISCEETTRRAGDYAGKDHGFCFEVPAGATGLVEPVAIRAMGRFRHEAVAVDPRNSIVYLTEDLSGRPALFYRYLPDAPGELVRGGRLQALAIRGRPSADTRNRDGGPDPIPVGEWLETEWIDLDHVEAPDDDLADRGFAAGAAWFTRGEGLWWGDGECYFACTDGGPQRLGQIWRYQPSPNEGGPDEMAAPGRVQLFVQSDDARVMEKCDNLCIAPWGDIIVVEDGDGDQFIRGVTPQGQVYTIGRNAASDASGEKSEITGPCFSPDGSTLFFNVQKDPGRTFAVRGPWASRSA